MKKVKHLHKKKCRILLICIKLQWELKEIKMLQLNTMIKKLVILVCCLGNILSVYAQNAIKVDIGYPVWKDNSNDQQFTIIITLDENGIIEKVLQKSKTGEKEIATVHKSSGILIIHSRFSTINEIEINETNISLTGESFCNNKKDSIKVFISPSENVIFQSEYSILEKKGSDLEEKIFKETKIEGYRLKRNTVFIDYKKYQNVNEKLVYNNKYLVTYYYRMGDGFEEADYDKYSPAIKISGYQLYNDNIKVNVINHYILVAADPLLAGILFIDNFK